MQITLKAARINAGIKQIEAARYLKKSKITLSRWENGKSDIPVKDFRKLCSLYKVNESNIFLPNLST